MKNHGYEFKQNVGRDQRCLAMMLANLNLLARARHTALELPDPRWIAAREAAAKRTQLLRSSGHHHRLRGLSILDRLTRSRHHLYDHARTDANP